MPAFLGAVVTLSGTTWVVVVSAPASGKQRQILSAMAENLDTVTHLYRSRKNKAGVFFNYPSVEVAAGLKSQLISNCAVLVATDESYEVSTAEATTTTESKVDPATFEVP